MRTLGWSFGAGFFLSWASRREAGTSRSRQSRVSAFMREEPDRKKQARSRDTETTNLAERLVDGIS
jgi:hypothetical protein